MELCDLAKRWLQYHWKSRFGLYLRYPRGRSGLREELSLRWETFCKAPYCFEQSDISRRPLLAPVSNRVEYEPVVTLITAEVDHYSSVRTIAFYAS